VTRYCWRCAALVWADDDLPNEPQMTHCRRCKAKNVILPRPSEGNVAPALDTPPRHVLKSPLTTI